MFENAFEKSSERGNAKRKYQVLPESIDRRGKNTLLFKSVLALNTGSAIDMGNRL